MNPGVKAVLQGALLPFALLVSAGSSMAQSVPDDDRRLTEIRHLDLTYTFPEYRTKEEWLARADHLRKQILFSAGLWPMPEKHPLKPVIFGKVDRGDHTIEKVYFESLPGYYVTGNLYRPKNVTGKLPGVLTPHGHWTYGRFENNELNSGPGRAANFARQGYVAFTYDMVGYGDNTAISHRFADHNATRRNALWGVTMLGLQLWNSIRSVDFLISLPEVDPERIACTGESGGGTQTFLLMAIDDRIKLAAPVNMISFHMQGGSLCENAPNLRIETNNVEFGAMMAPRPLMLVSATGDWTKNTMTSEYPAIRSIYRLFGAEDKVTAVQMDAPHNYNRESREAVYGWFAHWFLGRQETSPIRERGTGVPPLSDIMVFFSRPRPENEVNEERLSAYLIETAKKQFDRSYPADASGLDSFREKFGTALKYSLMAEYPEASSIIASKPQVSPLNEQGKGGTKEEFFIARAGRGERIPMRLWKQPGTEAASSIVLLLSSGSVTNNTVELTELLMKNGHTVASIVSFPGGRRVPEKIKYLTTYNKTDEAHRVQEILTAIAYLKKQYGNARLSIVAQDEAGLWALLARGLAPRIDRMVVDASKFDASNDEEFLKYLPIPGIRRAGDFKTSVTISPLTPLFIHNTGDKFRTSAIAEVYSRFGRAADCQTQQTAITNASLVAWLTN
jgi:Acetyl xylan esterase (AXE1)